nr:crosslink repair DNA glycosylase YcaQ family protein [Schaalia suimastitidis]
MRMIALGLSPATAAASPANAVERLLAIQGQQVSSISPAIAVRCPGASRDDIAAAFDQGLLVRSWPMRGTVHITTAADHHWLRAALAHRYEAWLRSSEQTTPLLGSGTVARAAELLWERMADQGALTRAQAVALFEEHNLIPRGVKTPKGADMTQSFEVSWSRRHLIFLLHLKGLVVQGPTGSNEHLLIDARPLPDETSGPGGGQGVRHGQAGHQAALVEIAYRYAAGHGPISADDLARWSGLPVGVCVTALEAALTRSDGEGLVRMRMNEEGSALVADSHPPSARHVREHGLYLRADLPDLLSEQRKAVETTIALPSFDELHVGYKDRTCLTDEAGERLICPSKNGMFRPIIVDRGRVVAVNPPSAGVLWAQGQPASARLENAVARVIASENTQKGAQ